MKVVVVALSLICFLLIGCNTVGPYTANVYRLEAAVFRVNVDTWLGSGNDSPTVEERLKRTTEALVKKELGERGLPAERCEFVRFISSEGGHITIMEPLKNSPLRWNVFCSSG